MSMVECVDGGVCPASSEKSIFEKASLEKSIFGKLSPTQPFFEYRAHLYRRSRHAVGDGRYGALRAHRVYERRKPA